MGKVKPPAAGDPGALDDLVFGILAESERRTVLRHLAHCPYPVSVDELVAVVTAEEAEASVEKVDEKRRTAVGLMLVHVHVPKLVESGLVEYGPDGACVVLSELGRDLAGTRPRAWSGFDITFDGTDAPDESERT